MEKLFQNVSMGEDGIWYSGGSTSISYPEDGHGECYAIEDNSFWFAHRNNCIAELVRTFPPDRNGAIFDIGGGNGFVARGLVEQGHDVVLIEPGVAGARNAKRRGLANVVCATLQSAQPIPGAMAAAGLFDVVEHIEDDLGFLRSIHALLQPGGKLYATVPAYNFLWSGEDVDAGHFRRYTCPGLANIFEEAGFSVDYATYIFSFLPLPVFMFRAIPSRVFGKRKTVETHGSLRDHVPPNPLVQKAMDVFFRFEIGRIRSAKRIPFGGSCLISATKH